MIIQIRPAGLGCACGGACDTCKSGVGDAQNPTIIDQLWGALTSTLPLGPNGIPVWVLVVAGLAGAAMLSPGASEYRRK